MDDKKTVEVLFKFGIIDEAEAKKAKKVLDGVSTSAATAKKNIIEVRENMEKLSQVGMKMSMAGAAILAPFILASNKYVTATQRNEAVSSRWLDSTKRIEQAQISLGRSVTSVLNPALESTAGLVENIAQAFANNPLLTVGAIGAGGGLLAGGAGLTAAAQLAQTAMTLKLLFPSAIALAGTVIAPVAAILAAIGAGAFAGVAAYDKIIAPKTGGASSGQIATGGAYAIGNMLGKIMGYDDKEIERKSNVFAAIIGKITGAIDKNSPLWQKAQEGLPNTGAGGLGSRTRGENTSEQTLGQQRTAIIASYAQKILDIEKNYAMQRETAIANFALQQKQAAKQHQLELKRMEKQHGRNMDDLVAARDALGMVKEEQRYKDERADSQAAYKLQQQQARENFNLQLQQMAQAKNEQLRLQAAAQAKELQLLSYALKYKAMAETAYANQMIAIGNKFMAGIGSAFGSPKAKNYSQGEVLGSAQGGNLSNSNINVTIQGDGLSISQIQRAVSRNNASIIGGIGSAMRMATR